MPDFIGQIEAAIRQQHLLHTGERLLVAVSGGLDSMVLLHTLHRLGEKHRWALTVAHFNHQLRGRSSAADERLVRTTARCLDLPCVIGQADVRQHAREEHLSIEMAGRQLRHEFLARTAREQSCRSIALAHHADDQVELVLLRLLRGAGSEGLGGMKWRSPSPGDRRVRLVRPLLSQPKEVLGQFARDQNIVFREDASNASASYLRNRVRHELIPLLTRRYQPALTRVLLRSAEVLGQESEFLNGCAAEWLRQPKAANFGQLPVALQRRVVQRQLIELGIAPDFELIDALRSNCGTPLSVEPQLSLWRESDGRLRTRRRQAIRFQTGEKALDLRSRPSRAEFDGVRFEWTTKRRSGEVRGGWRAGCEWFDADRVGERILLRHWRPGDRFQSSGLPAAAKLQDLFTNAKVSREDRRHRVVAATADGTIWWVEGLRISEGFKLQPGTRCRLCWRWQRNPKTHEASRPSGTKRSPLPSRKRVKHPG